MSLNIDTLMDKITSHAQATALFDTVSGHEPKNAPGNGLHAAVWLGEIEPIESSAIDKVSIVVVFNVRIYSSFLSEPYDAIDPNLAKAVDTLVTAYCGDFELGGNARNIDIFGSSGYKLKADPGYLNQDGKLYRVFVITVPVLINDIWTETA